MVTAADIINLPSGEFAAVAPEDIDPFIADAMREVGGVYGERRDEAVKYLTAHLFARARKGTAAPSSGVTAVTVGPLTTQYAQPGFSGDQDELDLTVYGRRYKQIRLQCVGGAWVT